MAKALVSSLSVAFKKATQVTEDKEQAKKEHRQHIKVLIDKYFEDVPKGKAEGIRTAKELVEVIKLDLLLMGEATERTDNNPVDEAQVTRVQQALDMDDPQVKSLMNIMFGALNGANDDMDKDVVKVTVQADAPEGVDRSELFNESDNSNPSEGQCDPTDTSGSKA